MSLSNNAETITLQWLLTNGSPTRPTAWYMSLYTSDPGDDDSGTEVSGGSYARTAATFTVSGDTASNSGAVEFPAATASWGTVTHFGVHDALTSGNLIAHGSLTASKTVGIGDVVRCADGELDITAD